MQKDIKSFIKKVKAKGLKVKLDTNGSSPKELKELIDEGLIDYVAMDIKNDFSKYESTSGIMKINTEKIKESIDILEKSNIKYEFRTTIVKELHSIDCLKHICEYIGPNAKYYLQNYQDSENVLQKGLHSFSDNELKEMLTMLKQQFPNVNVRGL